jgi:hypothetical protein
MDVREEPGNGEGWWDRGRQQWVEGRRGGTRAKKPAKHGHGMLFWFILLLVQVGSAGGMNVLWPGGSTRLSPVTVPQGGGVLLGFSGEYSQGKALKQVHPPPLSFGGGAGGAGAGAGGGGGGGCGCGCQDDEG